MLSRRQCPRAQQSHSVGLGQETSSWPSAFVLFFSQKVMPTTAYIHAHRPQRQSFGAHSHRKAHRSKTPPASPKILHGIFVQGWPPGSPRELHPNAIIPIANISGVEAKSSRPTVRSGSKGRAVKTNVPSSPRVLPLYIQQDYPSSQSVGRGKGARSREPVTVWRARRMHLHGLSSIAKPIART